MAVIFAGLHWRGSTGGKKGASFDKAESNYTAVYRVTTDNPLDQADTIVNYFEATPNMPKLGDEYRFGNDYNPNAILTGIAPDHVDNSRVHWEVVLTYTPKSGTGDGEGTKDLENDANGNPTSDPRLYHNEYDISRTQINVPVWKAIYLGGMKGIAAGIYRPGDLVVPSNSAFVPFNPPLEKTATLTTLRVIKYRPAYQGVLWGPYEDALNSDVISLAGNPYNLQILWDKYTVLVKNIGGSFHLENNIKFWKIFHELQHNPLGWDVEVPDMGTMQRQMEGDRFPDGTAISTTDIADGMPIHRQILDPDGVPLAEPVLFDGDGKPLKNPWPRDTVWLKYRIYTNVRPLGNLILDR